MLLPTKIIEVRRISSLWKLKANINLVSGSNRASPSLLHSHMWHLCLWVKILRTVSLLKPSSSTRSIIERSAASPCLSKVPHYETHRTAYPTRTQSVLVSHLHLIQSQHYHILWGRISSLNSRFWALGFLIYTLSCANFKKKSTVKYLMSLTPCSWH